MIKLEKKPPCVYMITNPLGGVSMLNMIRPGQPVALGLKRTPEQIKNMSGENNHAYGKKFPRTKEQREAQTGDKNPMFGRSGGLAPRARKVINTETGVIYDTVKEAAISIGVPDNTLGMKLKWYGKSKNNTPFKYLS